MNTTPNINTFEAVQDSKPAQKIKKQSKRQTRVHNIGHTVADLALKFREVFPNEYRDGGDGTRIPVSDLKSLKISGHVYGEEKDDRTVLVISGSVWNTRKNTQYYPEIALYRTSVDDAWSVNNKGKVICDCNAYRYNLAYPNNTDKVFRNVGVANYAANTYADNQSTGKIKRKTKHTGGRIRKNEVGLCKHLKKLWDVASKDLNLLAKNGYI